MQWKKRKCPEVSVKAKILSNYSRQKLERKTNGKAKIPSFEERFIARKIRIGAKKQEKHNIGRKKKSNRRWKKNRNYYKENKSSINRVPNQNNQPQNVFFVLHKSADQKIKN